MKKLKRGVLFAIAVACLYAIPSYAADENLFANGTNLESVECTPLIKAGSDIGTGSNDLKTILTNGKSSTGDGNEKWYVQYPKKEGQETPSITFTFRCDTSLNRLVFYAGASTLSESIPSKDALIPSEISLAYSKDTSDNFTEVTGLKFENSIDIQNKKQILTCDFPQFTAKKLKITIKSGGGAGGVTASSRTYGFRIREVEAYNSTIQKADLGYVSSFAPAAGDVSKNQSQLTNNTPVAPAVMDNRLSNTEIGTATGAAVWYIKFPGKLDGTLPHITFTSADSQTINSIYIYGGSDSGYMKDWIKEKTVYIAYTPDGTSWKTVNMSNAITKSYYELGQSSNQKKQLLKLSFHDITAKNLKLIIGEGTGDGTSGNNTGFRIREIQAFHDPNVNIKNLFDTPSALPLEIYNAVFTDSKGNEVYSPTDGGKLTKFYLKWNQQTSASVIASVFENGELKDVRILPAKDEYELDEPIPVSAQSSVKVFTWDDLSTMKPLSDTYCVIPNKPIKIYTFGDSMTADSNDQDGQMGWPQKFIQYVDSNKATLDNSFSLSESSSSSIINDGKLNSLTEKITQGDYVICCFASNDQYKALADTGENNTYRYNLGMITNTIRKKGGIPIMMTPVCKYSEASDSQNIDKYVDDIKAVAQQLHIPLLDINSSTRNDLQTVDSSITETYYSSDKLHLTERGADWVSQLIIKEIEKLSLPLTYVLNK